MLLVACGTVFVETIRRAPASRSTLSAPSANSACTIHTGHVGGAEHREPAQNFGQGSSG
jgi:hypothetical protein